MRSLAPGANRRRAGDGVGLRFRRAFSQVAGGIGKEGDVAVPCPKRKPPVRGRRGRCSADAERLRR